MADFCSLQNRLRTAGWIRFWSARAALVPAALLFTSGLIGSESCSAADKPAKASADSKHGADSDSTDEADSEVDLHLSALVVPARLGSKLKDAEKQKFSQELRVMLLEGFKEKGDSLEAARKHFETAHQLPGNDPRTPYAYGVVLVKQNKSAIAVEQFRNAARNKKIAYLPALQAVAWTTLSRADYAQGLPALLELARRLEEPQETWPAAEDRENSAEWVGRAVGYLTGPGKRSDQAALIDRLATDVANVLTAERKTAYERGRQAAAAQFDELKVQAARPEAELAAEAAQQREKTAVALAAARLEVKQIEDELAVLKRPHDKELVELARAIHDNSMKIKTTTPRVPAVEAEVEELSEPKKHASIRTMQSNNRRQTSTSTQKVIREENAGEKKIRESQLASAQKRLENIKSSLEDAQRAVADAKQKREEEHATFRKDTAGKRQALQLAQQKAAELAARARDAEHGQLTPELLKARATALESYVPFYPDLERDRLLASLKPAS
jgi:hypothetical protein